MRIALTGSTGFVGRHVLAALANRGLEIVLLVRDASRVAHRRPVIEIVEGDIRTPNGLFKKLGSPQVLIHLAWAGLPNYKSLHHFEDELPKQYRFIKSMVEAGLKSVLITGTCFEYGMQSGQLDECLMTQPDNPYAYAKDALRRQLAFLKRDVPFALNWTRLFYMYGEGQSATSLYPALASAVIRGDKVFNMSGGQQLRDYLPVEVVAENIVALALSEQEHGVVNVCSGQPIAVIDLVRGWIDQHGWQIELNPGFYPYPDYEPMAFWGDPSKMHAALAT
jgi:nucleoside-diphosphate-sugar epimerase